ncbi:PrgI family protein [Patescibacteria group bacterium]|nr:PrgI family protein [Patescibacteria group bacterium]
MQYKIPQNVRREDKIVGPLTLKQLIILGVGGGISYALYVALAKTYVLIFSIGVALVPFLFTLALTFIVVNGIPFHKWVLLLSEYLSTAKQRTFIMGGADIYSATIFAKKTTDQKVAVKSDEEETKTDKIKKLGEITKILDTYNTPPKK